MAGMILGVLILMCAAAILVRRAVRFVRTKGRSGCDGCPYSGRCGSGSCSRPPEG